MEAHQYVFGPVPSRRLGRSLGVDIIPRKLCTLDCTYCEVGRTDKRALRRQEYVPTEAVMDELRSAYLRDSQLDTITFSGSGEPTLHAGIGRMIRETKDFAQIPVSVITNGTLLFQEDVRRDLLAADLVLPSLDAVSPEVFEKVNRPHPHLEIETIIAGLKRFREEYSGAMWIEVLLVEGQNDSAEELERLRTVIKEIAPDRIQLNTVVRPPAIATSRPVDARRLEEIRTFFGESCEIIGSFQGNGSATETAADPEHVLALLQRRPMTNADLASVMHVSVDSMRKTLNVLECHLLITPFTFQKETHYRAVDYTFHGYCG